MTHDELRERVARAMWDVPVDGDVGKMTPEEWAELKRHYLKEADAAIAVVLEEAARVANRMYQTGQIGPDIAAAIRALIQEKPSE